MNTSLSTSLILISRKNKNKYYKAKSERKHNLIPQIQGQNKFRWNEKTLENFYSIISIHHKFRTQFASFLTLVQNNESFVSPSL